MTPEEIEKLAVKHEDFGFGKVDSHGLTTHGFSPEGLAAFVQDILDQERRNFNTVIEALDPDQNRSDTPENLQKRKSTNTWDHIDDVLEVIELARAGRWVWMSNTLCKYIELRIDMRDGGCILKNRNSVRINVSDLKKQQFSQQWTPWVKPQTSTSER